MGPHENLGQMNFGSKKCIGPVKKQNAWANKIVGQKNVRPQVNFELKKNCCSEKNIGEKKNLGHEKKMCALVFKSPIGKHCLYATISFWYCFSDKSKRKSTPNLKT